MLWIIFCVDKPGTELLRNQHLGSHRAYLGANVHRLFFSGPHLSDDGGAQIGSVFILKAESREEVQAFLDGEDLYRVGVFDTVTIRRLRRGRLNVDLADG
ncbi:YciI family protein [Variovorax sp. LjRoot178]|uniref:YciI family protein n=1 Tax=Variovorax sp. LjRoot178 TaxID=3342277 RepID=UPI003ECF26B6